MVVEYLGHGVHALIVLGGIVAVVLLLAPARRQALAPLGEHELRVALLRERVTTGALLTAEPLPAVIRDPGPARLLRPAYDDGTTSLLVAAVASTAAAGVHGAVTPAHLGEGLAVGLFFLITALAQSAWSCAVLWRPERRLLLAGLVGNCGVVMVWMVSRTVGIPFVAGGQPEPLGVLDLAATGWELVLIVSCVRLVSRPALPCPPPSWHRWPLAARSWVALSVSLLGLLTLLDLHT